MFYVGQLVLCVDDDSKLQDYAPPPGRRFVDDLGGLTRGVVYTVRRVGCHWYLTDVPLVWLEEIVRPTMEGDPEEIGFAADRFRPLKDSALDVFTALLEPAPKETEPA